jgi:hypothetical protein
LTFGTAHFRTPTVSLNFHRRCAHPNLCFVVALVRRWHIASGLQGVPQMADLETNETETLIASNKVEGTAVYNPEGKKLGSIYNFMVDKESGQVEYAVLQFGGLLGIGSNYYPVPWPALEYDEEQGGYVIDIDKGFLENAPHFGANETPRFTPAYGSEVNAAYGIEYEEV